MKMLHLPWDTTYDNIHDMAFPHIYIYIYTKHGHTQYLEKMVKDYCHLLHLAESDKVEKTTSYLKIATPN